MQQSNAFEVLGVVPSDSVDVLQEKLEEKELLSDDVTVVQQAYADLTNPKKRLIHEVLYFCSEDLMPFKNLVFHGFKTSPKIKEVAQILVDLGHWFEYDSEELLTLINEAREEGGFKNLEASSLTQAENDLRADCLQSANDYIDGLRKHSIIEIFNYMVRIEDYDSFFADELIAHYELYITESLQKMEMDCRSSFAQIESACQRFNNGISLPYDLKENISVFKSKLEAWDRCAQPLQVNMQNHGVQHEESENLLHEFRGRTIDLCNKSQEVLGKLLQEWNNYFSIPYNPYNHSRPSLASIRERIVNKVPGSLALIDHLISLTDIFQSVFAELDIDAERLAKDKKDLLELRAPLAEMNKSIEESRRAANRQNNYSYSRPASVSRGGCYIATCVYGSYDCPSVWVLRRYRDDVLAVSLFGRWFIRVYYAVSPFVVKAFGRTKWFQKFWKGILDRKVKLLQLKGFESTPYQDKDW